MGRLKESFGVDVERIRFGSWVGNWEKHVYNLSHGGREFLGTQMVDKIH